MGIPYGISPVKMGGLVKEVSGHQVKVHLHGRLGVITVPDSLVDFPPGKDPAELAPGHALSFYFSYIQIRTEHYGYDSTELRRAGGFFPCLLGGVLTEVNDTAAKLAIMDGLGTIAVPRRWLFTDVPLAEGQSAEFYLSRMAVVGKREVPVESI